jgi:hypothetical protein
MGVTNKDQAFQATSKEGSLRNVFSFFIVLISLVPASALAIVSAEVLPKGVRAGAFVWGGSSTVTSSFDEKGDVRSLARPLNRSVTLDDIAESEPDVKTLENVLNSLGPMGLGEQLFLSNIYSDVKVNEQRYVTGLLWGVTDRLSLGVIVPVVKRETRVSFDVDIVNNAKALQAKIGHLPRVREGLQQFIDAGISPEMFVSEIFTSNGYIAPTYHSFNALGDIELESRYRFYKDERLSLALRSTVKLPTARHETDLRNLFDREAGEGVPSVKLGVAQSLQLLPHRLSLHTAAFGTYRFAGRKTVALPQDPSEPLANLNDPTQIETVQKELGASANSDVGLMLDFWKGGVSFMTSFQSLVRAADKYSGTRGLDYARLNANTAGYEHGVEFSLEFSSVPLFLDKKALAPAKLSFSWYQPLAGKNMIYAPYGRMDAILLF